jgi:VIT1/CCC1 family predicted Fe2+/Mn2+ transporter
MTAEGATLLRDTAAEPRADARTVRAGPAALVRDVILGGQDGLVNVLGLVLGMAVATGDAHVVVTAGLAALLAESIAMAGVAYTSSGAERQLARATRQTMHQERANLAAARAAERQARLVDAGLSTSARTIAEAEAAAEAEAWIHRLEEERAALSPVRETRPIRMAAIVGLSTALGSAVPLVPFIVLPIGLAPIAALAAGATVLAAAGIERAALAGGSRTRAAFEMLAIGLVSAFAGYLIGQVLRVPGA